MAITRLNNNSLTSITALPTAVSVGKVGQVLQGEYGTAVTLNTSGFTDTGLSLAITPVATSSKILVSVVQSIYSVSYTHLTLPTSREV